MNPFKLLASKAVAVLDYSEIKMRRIIPETFLNTFVFEENHDNLKTKLAEIEEPFTIEIPLMVAIQEPKLRIVIQVFLEKSKRLEEEGAGRILSFKDTEVDLDAKFLRLTTVGVMEIVGGVTVEQKFEMIQVSEDQTFMQEVD